MFKNEQQQWCRGDNQVSRHRYNRTVLLLQKGTNHQWFPSITLPLIGVYKDGPWIAAVTKNAGLSEVSEGLHLLFQPHAPLGLNIKQHCRQKDVDNILKPKTQITDISSEKPLLRCTLGQCCKQSKAKALASSEFIMPCCEYSIFLFQHLMLSLESAFYKEPIYMTNISY